jgi:hypothetical protein
MSYDLIFKNMKWNWARGVESYKPTPATPRSSVLHWSIQSFPFSEIPSKKFRFILTGINQSNKPVHVSVKIDGALATTAAAAPGKKLSTIYRGNPTANDLRKHTIIIVAEPVTASLSNGQVKIVNEDNETIKTMSFGQLPLLNTPMVSGDEEVDRLPPEYRDAYDHGRKLAQARGQGDSKSARDERSWLEKNGWSVKLPAPDAPFKRIVLSKPGLPKKIAVNTMSGELVGLQEIMGSAEIMGSEEIMGEFVGDEARLARDAGPAERAASARMIGDLCGRAPAGAPRAAPAPPSSSRAARREAARAQPISAAYLQGKGHWLKVQTSNGTLKSIKADSIDPDTLLVPVGRSRGVTVYKISD